MNKTDLINAVAEKLETTKKEATVIVDSTLEAVVEGLVADGKVNLMGFGNFVVRNRAARKGRNPQTSEEILIPASKLPAWKPAKALKNIVKNS